MLQSLGSGMNKRVGICAKLKLLLKDPKAMSNKAIEICVTLLSLYLVVELNNIPQGCDTLGPCLSQYIADGGDVEPDFPFSSCGQMTQACELSFAKDLANPRTDVETQLAQELSPFVDFCSCLLDGASVFCEFRLSTFAFLLVGLVVIYMAEITANEEDKSDKKAVNNGPRRFAMFLAMLYFIASLVFYTSLVGCQGPDFEETQRIVVFLSLACTVIVVALVFLEEFSLCLHRASKRHPKKDDGDGRGAPDDDDDDYEAEMAVTEEDLAEVDVDEYNNEDGDISIVETHTNEDGVAVTTC
eukprot:m.52590 g.52590  ORF g.52590 m.52590 type:complete len:300 (-) comp13512_c0_seq2:167-1066(-)